MTNEEAVAYARALDLSPAGYGRLLADFAKIRAAHDAWLRVPSRERYWSHQAFKKLKQVRDEQRNAFARSRGWKVANHFTVQQLKAGRMIGPRWDGMSSVIDHPDYFTVGRRPVAILSHSYAPFEDSAKFARDEGLHIELLPYSWYYPLNAIAVLFTRASE